MAHCRCLTVLLVFLSIQAQDFIEEDGERSDNASPTEFLSIQAQDFIEDVGKRTGPHRTGTIPEHSSSGLH